MEYVEYTYEGGYPAGKTLTVGAMIEILGSYPRDFPVLAEWEGIFVGVNLHSFSVSNVTLGGEENRQPTVIMDVNNY